MSHNQILFMKARIIKKGNFWVGEVYGTWSMMGLFDRVGWGLVTDRCYTRLGAKLQLMKWKQERC